MKTRSCNPQPVLKSATLPLLAGRVGLRVEAFGGNGDNEDGARGLAHLQHGGQVRLRPSPPTAFAFIRVADDDSADLRSSRRGGELERGRLARHERRLARFAPEETKIVGAGGGLAGTRRGGPIVGVADAINVERERDAARAPRVAGAFIRIADVGDVEAREPNGFTPLKSFWARPSQKFRKLKTALITEGVWRGSTRRTFVGRPVLPSALKTLSLMSAPLSSA